MTFLRTAKQIGEKLKNVPKIWDGREAILEMKEYGYSQWKQMEWIGFYFQFLCERYLSDFMEIPGPRYGNSGERIGFLYSYQGLYCFMGLRTCSGS